MFVGTMALGDLPPQLANNAIGKRTSGLLSFLIFYFDYFLFSLLCFGNSRTAQVEFQLCPAILTRIVFL